MCGRCNKIAICCKWILWLFCCLLPLISMNLGFLSNSHVFGVDWLEIKRPKNFLVFCLFWPLACHFSLNIYNGRHFKVGKLDQVAFLFKSELHYFNINTEFYNNLVEIWKISKVKTILQQIQNDGYLVSKIFV